jgi:hypothetical protein
MTCKETLENVAHEVAKVECENTNVSSYQLAIAKVILFCFITRNEGTKQLFTILLVNWTIDNTEIQMMWEWDYEITSANSKSSSDTLE